MYSETAALLAVMVHLKESTLSKRTTWLREFVTLAKGYPLADFLEYFSRIGRTLLAFLQNKSCIVYAIAFASTLAPSLVILNTT